MDINLLLMVPSFFFLNDFNERSKLIIITFFFYFISFALLFANKELIIKALKHRYNTYK